ncbi:family 16 glycosylhydrolase [Neorhodopirellula lusitana]|uniref:family 16 glycosylhydrolase n=1 Tax=Neorhodopirellula lusitana TaxID=445327 RepID=UPI00384F3DA5
MFVDSRCLFACFVLILVAAPVVADGLPSPPEGYRWEKNEAFSDEFDGDQLDSAKWYDHNPRWKGRAPGLFVPSAISVGDGYLCIRCGVLDPPQGEFSVACGAVQSKAKTALYGYYECRMKASSIPTSSTFWLTSESKKVDGGRLSFELDIQECVGRADRFAVFTTHMKSNTHVNFQAEEKGAETQRRHEGGQAPLKSKVDDEFHTYACWWVDATTVKFYADGEYQFTVHPPVDFGEAPFDFPMFMNLVCETYDWNARPTVEELSDDTRNATFYDYVRSYRLVKSE